MFNYKKFGQDIQAYRSKHRISQKTLSELLGISASTLARAEKGDNVKWCFILTLVKDLNFDLKNYYVERDMNLMKFYRDAPLDIVYEVKVSMSQFKKKKNTVATQLIIPPAEKEVFQPVVGNLDLEIIEDNEMPEKCYALSYSEN